MPRTFFAILLGSLILALPLPTMGSGSYPGRPPRPPSTVDAAQYHLGKQIFTGVARLGDGTPASASQQEARLQELQVSLPRTAQQSVNLPALAGKLSSDLMAALEYYLAIRFKIRLNE